MKRVEMVGRRFGSLVVIGAPASVKTKSQRRLFYRVRCDCGTEKPVAGTSLRRGSSKSCGCEVRRKLGDRSRTHGESNPPTPEFIAWMGMRNRCNNKNSEDYPRYGGRGIRVSRRWQKSYKNFLADMNRRPSRAHSLHRKDNDKGYSRANCIWATPKEQASNRDSYRGPSKVAALRQAIRDLIDALPDSKSISLSRAIANAEHVITLPRKRRGLP